MVTSSFDDTKDNQVTVNPQDMSMEDVLASIRKILDSDNDTDSIVAQTEEEKKEESSSATLRKGERSIQSDHLSRDSSPSTEGADTPTENAKKDRVFSAILSPSDKGSEEDEAEDVLELTQEIRDDGSEIDLRSQAKGGKSARGTFPETSTTIDTSDVLTLPTGTGAADVSGAVSPSKPEDYNLDDLYADPLLNSGQEASSDKNIKGKDEKPASGTHSSKPKDGEVEEFMHNLDTEVSQSAAKESSHEDENPLSSHHKASGASHDGTYTPPHTHYRQASGPSLDTHASYQYMHFQDSLLSQESSTASLEILKHLSHTLAHDEKKGAPGPSLEAVVLTALRPILKEWVDKNLPDLISKIVREEIKELVAQAKPK